MATIETPSPNQLWNSDITPTSYATKELYFTHLFEQYKLYVEMADKISERRNVANTFFLTLHTLLIGIAGFTYEKGPHLNYVWINVLPLIAVLALCYVWYRLIQSYRQLNSAKYQVVGQFESRLPASPYVRAEWVLLGEGKKPDLYRPLSDVERWVPVLFALLYILGFCALLLL